jgi:hypothetical protein
MSRDAGLNKRLDKRPKLANYALKLHVLYLTLPREDGYQAELLEAKCIFNVSIIGSFWQATGFPDTCIPFLHFWFDAAKYVSLVASMSRFQTK